MKVTPTIRLWDAAKTLGLRPKTYADIIAEMGIPTYRWDGCSQMDELILPKDCLQVRTAWQGILQQHLLSAKAIATASQSHLPLAANVSGVYFLLQDHQISYIGESGKMVQRIAHHLSKCRSFDTAYLLPIPEDARKLTEALYIHYLKPPENGGYSRKLVRQWVMEQYWIKQKVINNSLN